MEQALFLRRRIGDPSGLGIRERSFKNGDVGIIRLEDFEAQDACQRIADAGQDFKAAGVQGVILDLRDNPGGDVSIAKCLLSLFLEDGSVYGMTKNLQTGEFNGAVMYKGNHVFDQMPSVVLVDGGSASASEWSAGYLKAYRKSFILGERSFGKGSMQQGGLFKGNKNVIKFSTVALFFWANGGTPQLKGVTPDFTVLPRLGQTEPTPFQREADLFPNAIKPPDTIVPEDTVRLKEVATIKACLDRNDHVGKVVSSLNEYDEMVFDVQQETAVAVIDCFHQEKLPIHTERKIPSTFNLPN